MSSDDNNNNNNHLIRSSSPTNQSSKKSPIQSKTSLDKIDDINQQDQSPRMASPTLSTSSQSSKHVTILLNHEIIELPVYLEREIFVKNNFDQLGKEELI